MFGIATAEPCGPCRRSLRGPAWCGFLRQTPAGDAGQPTRRASSPGSRPRAHHLTRRAVPAVTSRRWRPDTGLSRAAASSPAGRQRRRPSWRGRDQSQELGPDPRVERAHRGRPVPASAGAPQRGSARRRGDEQSPRGQEQPAGRVRRRSDREERCLRRGRGTGGWRRGGGRRRRRDTSNSTSGPSRAGVGERGCWRTSSSPARDRRVVTGDRGRGRTDDTPT